MKKILDEATLRYTYSYDSNTEFERHAATMTKQGWDILEHYRKIHDDKITIFATYHQAIVVNHDD